jgi:tetratricopeptide (TPR) repeat protein
MEYLILAIFAIIFLGSIAYGIYTLTGNVIFAKNQIKNEIQSHKVKKSDLYMEKASEALANADFDTAFRYMNDAIRINPKFYDYYGFRGWTKILLGNYESALKDLDYAIYLESQDEILYTYRAAANNALGNFNQAIIDSNKSISLNNNYSPAYIQRGSAYGKSGNYNQAMNDFNTAIRIYPDDSSIYDARAEIYKDNGYTEYARKDWEYAIQLNPSFKRFFQEEIDNLFKINEVVTDYKVIEPEVKKIESIIKAKADYGESL